MSFDDVDQTKYLIFEIGGSLYASQLSTIDRVLEKSVPLPIPNATTFFKGVINFRGDVIGVFDLCERFQLAQTKSHHGSYIVYEVQKSRFAATVDRIHAIYSVPSEKLTTQIPTKTSIPQQFLTGLFEWKSQLVLVVDLKKVMSEQEIADSSITLSKIVA